VTRPIDPAEPLWRLAPTHDENGQSLADFMMLIPRLGDCPAGVRDCIGSRIRDVCATFGDRVAFADVNYSLNVLWVSVAAEPGLAGQVAQAIRAQVPQARLIGGQLGAVPSGLVASPGRRLWQRLRRLGRRCLLLPMDLR
jgi:hypothetical protein